MHIKAKTMNEMNVLSKVFPSESGLTPSILGRSFQLTGDAEIYSVMGLKGCENRVVLQSESSGEIRYMSFADFLKSATRVEN
jgi:hypothetical protein